MILTTNNNLYLAQSHAWILNECAVKEGMMDFTSVIPLPLNVAKEITPNFSDVCFQTYGASQDLAEVQMEKVPAKIMLPARFPFVERWCFDTNGTPPLKLLCGIHRMNIEFLYEGTTVICGHERELSILWTEKSFTVLKGELCKN